MFCTQCGSRIEDGFKFCPECGNSIEDCVNNNLSIDNQKRHDNRTPTAESKGYSYCPHGKSLRTETVLQSNNLIQCPTCGKSISEKAASCPSCGCPAENYYHVIIECEQGRIEVNGSYLSIINSKGVSVVTDRFDNFLLLFSDFINGAYGMIFSHGSLSLSYGCRVKSQYKNAAVELSDEFSKIGLKINGLSWFKAFRYKNDMQLVRKQQEKAQMQENLQNISAMGDLVGGRKKGVVYESKKLSVGRGLVGYGLAGPAGAVLGGLTSKKRQAIDPETGKKLSKREARKRMK